MLHADIAQVCFLRQAPSEEFGFKEVWPRVGFELVFLRPAELHR